METDLHKLRIDKAHKARRDERVLWPWIVIAVFFVLGAALLVQWRIAAAAPAVETMRVRIVDRASVAEADSVVLHAAGYVMAAHKIELASKVVGRVAWVGAEMGDRINKDQVLVRLEDDEYKASVAQRQG